MASIKSDPKLSAVDRAIRRVNTDLKRAANLFGTQSSQYRTMETYASKLLAQAGAAGLALRKMVDPVSGQSYVQLPRSRAALSSWTDETSSKMIKKMERSADYKKQEQWYVERYKEQHGGQLPAKGAAGRRMAVQEMASVHIQLNDQLDRLLQALYDLREITGDDDAVQQIRTLSRGQWTTAATKRDMIAIAQEAVMEQEQIVREYFAEIGLDYDEM